jgi:hypothetical protein
VQEPGQPTLMYAQCAWKPNSFFLVAALARTPQTSRAASGRDKRPGTRSEQARRRAAMTDRSWREADTRVQAARFARNRTADPLLTNGSSAARSPKSQ